MHGMIMQMLWNAYGMIIFACYCSSRWVSEVVRWWCMVYLLCFKSLCVGKVEGLYRVGGYSGIGSSRVYSEGGHGGSHTGGGCSKEGYVNEGQGYGGESGCYSGSYRGYVGKENDIKGYDKKDAGDENLVIEKHMVDKEVVIKNLVGRGEHKK